MSRFRDFTGGTLKCRLISSSPERFLNLCRNRNLRLSDIRGCSQGIEFAIGLKDYRKLRPVVRKCHSVPHICSRHGLPFILHKNRRHRAFFIGIFAAAIILWIISGFIWNIEIEGNISHTDEVLMDFLEQIHIYAGQSKNAIDTAFLEEELRLEYKDISWVSARIEGTVLKIQLKEAAVFEPETDSLKTGDLVAVSDGEISSIITRSGTALVSPGMQVKAGDILIRGSIDIMNDDGTVKETRDVQADGDVYGIVTEHCCDYYPSWYVRKNYTGKTAYAVSVTAFAHTFNLGPVNSASAKNFPCEQTQQIYKYRLTDSFYLPLQISLSTIKEYTPEKVYYTKEQLEESGTRAIAGKLAMLKNNNADILFSDLQVICRQEYYVIKGEIRMTIPIGRLQPHI